MGWWGLADAAEESRLGEESREEEGSEDKECGDIGLPNGDTANISATKKPASKGIQGAATLPMGSPTTLVFNGKRTMHLKKACIGN